MTDIRIRPETRSDIQAIREVIMAAFGQVDEADLIDRLRNDGDLTLSLIAETDRGDLIGQVALSRLGSPAKSLALAPVAVLPEHQGQGIGSALIRAAVAQARASGNLSLFVLGDPAYYTRFGFTLSYAKPFKCVYAGPYFMGMALQSEPILDGAVLYARAFESL